MKFLILGAGPAGLTVANRLIQNGVSDFLVLENESQAGGLCRSTMVDGAPLDIGGGHFLDVQRPLVDAFLFQFMPIDEWDKYIRDSRISIHGFEVSHPLEANIWQMPIDDQIEYLKSIAAAGCNIGVKMPADFKDWIYWKLGNKIAADYMIPYNQKMFGEELNNLGTYWLDKLPNVSFEDTLRSCLENKAYAKQPGHAQFYYPKKYGFGELWLRMAEAIKGHIEYKKKVDGINFATHTITTNDGGEYQADVIISTIPWMEFSNIEGMPDAIKNSIHELKYTSIEVEYFPENLNTKAQWIYYPDLKLPYHRILVRHNFCPNSSGYWTETNIDRIHNPSDSIFKYVNKYAYPLNTIEKPAIMKTLLDWCRDRNVYGLGRWGEHCHFNSDKTVELAMQMADEIIKQP